MLENKYKEEILLTWHTTSKNIMQAFSWLHWRLFFKNKWCSISSVGVGLSLTGFISLIINYSTWGFGQAFLTTIGSMMALVFSGMFIAFRWGDLKDKKLTKLDIEFFLKNLNPNALKFFNTTWQTNQDGFSRDKEISYEDLLAPFKRLQDKDIQDKKRIKEEAAKKNSINVTDIMELGETLLVKSERSNGLINKDGKKRLL